MPPSQIRILHLTIPVVWDAARLLRITENEGEALHGIYQQNTIYVSPAGPEPRKKETLLHEILHAIIDQTALATGPLSGDNEEIVVRTLAPLLLHTLQNNKAIVRYLLD